MPTGPSTPAPPSSWRRPSPLRRASPRPPRPAPRAAVGRSSSSPRARGWAPAGGDRLRRSQGRHRRPHPDHLRGAHRRRHHRQHGQPRPRRHRLRHRGGPRGDGRHVPPGALGRARRRRPPHHLAAHRRGPLDHRAGHQLRGRLRPLAPLTAAPRHRRTCAPCMPHPTARAPRLPHTSTKTSESTRSRVDSEVLVEVLRGKGVGGGVARTKC